MKKGQGTLVNFINDEFQGMITVEDNVVHIVQNVEDQSHWSDTYTQYRRLTIPLSSVRMIIWDKV
jgi:hypothetical protein